MSAKTDKAYEKAWEASGFSLCEGVFQRAWNVAIEFLGQHLPVTADGEFLPLCEAPVYIVSPGSIWPIAHWRGSLRLMEFEAGGMRLFDWQNVWSSAEAIPKPEPASGSEPAMTDTELIERLARDVFEREGLHPDLAAELRRRKVIP